MYAPAKMPRAMPLDLTLLIAAHALVEIAGLMLLVRGLLWLLGPKARKGNFFYDMLTIGTLPFIRLARLLSPRVIKDVYVPAIAFTLVFCVWISLGIGKEVLCASRGLQCV